MRRIVLGVGIGLALARQLMARGRYDVLERLGDDVELSRRVSELAVACTVVDAQTEPTEASFHAMVTEVIVMYGERVGGDR